MRPLIAALAALSVLTPCPANADPVRLKDLGRFQGWRENALVGYGVVTGLSGSGDSPNSEVTQQALRNALSRLGTNVTPEQIRSRNVAVVMVTATLPASANVGDRIDINVTSIGDARSLAGGTLLMTPLMGPDQRPYALAQGSVVVGGYAFASNQNLRQKNYPASGVVSGGATVEQAVDANLVSSGGQLVFVLREPDFTTAARVADGINADLGAPVARIKDADSVSIDVSAAPDVYRVIARVENVLVEPASVARVVINERSGTVVAGGAVRISSVVISQGDIRVSITTQNEASQPTLIGGLAPGVSSLVVSNTRVDVERPGEDAMVQLPDTTVADLMEALSRVHVDTRGKIAVLQALKAAGALHADLVVQ